MSARALLAVITLIVANYTKSLTLADTEILSLSANEFPKKREQGMHKLELTIAEHHIEIDVASDTFKDWLIHKFAAKLVVDYFLLNNVNLSILVIDVFGTPFESYNVEITYNDELITYLRNDYRIQVTRDFSKAFISAYDEFALNHAMMALYSAFIAHHNWGVMTHSSCIVDHDNTHLFAGQSGAGKSTIAMLSEPRMILSDEAALVKVSNERVQVFNSPFRSDSVWEAHQIGYHYDLKGYHLLRQSQQIRREPIHKTEALIYLMNTIFYWAYLPEETAKVVSMCRMLVNAVPFYDLYFQKNDLFWREIHEHTHEQYI